MELESLVTYFLTEGLPIFYFAIFILLFLNSSIMIPSSEVICSLAGMLYQADFYSLAMLAIIGAIANTCGTLPWYYLGTKHIEEKKHLDEYVDTTTNKFIKYLLILYLGSLRTMETLFNAYKYNLILFLRNIPIIRSICSYPAARAGLRFTPFLLYSFFGILFWVFTWMLLGWGIGRTILDYHITIAAIIVIIAVFSFKYLLTRASNTVDWQNLKSNNQSEKSN